MAGRAHVCVRVASHLRDRADRVRPAAPMIRALPGPRPWPSPSRSVRVGGGLAVLVGARIALNGSGAASAFLAGIVFGTGLLALAAWAGRRVPWPGLGSVGGRGGGGLA